jgi:hypothetical protein
MSSRENDQVIVATDEPRSRRDLLRVGGAAAIAGVLGVLGITTATEAKNGTALRAGAKTTATKSTTLESRKGPAFQAKVSGSGSAIGLRGASSSPKGIGVQGTATAGKGEPVGVQGLAQSGDGTAGQFIAAEGGIALEAVSAKKAGVALRTEGKLQFTGRSGVSSVSGGAEFVIPVAGGLGDKSIVIATLQSHFPGVHVESASVLDAEDGLIVVRLSQAIPEPANVGWIVLD